MVLAKYLMYNMEIHKLLMNGPKNKTFNFLLKEEIG